MANCNGSIDMPIDNGCSSNNNRTISTMNCSCTPCSAPVIVDYGDYGDDVAARDLIPVLADVIQNCITINKYETAYPDNWVFETNIPERSGACGKITIRNIAYSYDCIGVDSQFINGFVGSKSICLASDQPACFCEDMSMPKPHDKPMPKHPDKLYNEFKGTVKTDSCCCDDEQQAYDLTKIVEKNVSLAICNLDVMIQGTIGGTPFVAKLVGTKKDEPSKTPYHEFEDLKNPTPLCDLGLPNNINIAGRLCLPTNTKLKISEQFDNCLIIDCIRPLNTTLQQQGPHGGSKPKAVLASEVNKIDNEAIEVDEFNEVDSLGYQGGGHQNNGFIKFDASADLSLIINKQIYATTTQSVALLTNFNSQVVCTDAASTQPVCPTVNPCANSKPSKPPCKPQKPCK